MRCSQGILNSAVRPCLQVLACRCLPKGRALGAQLKATLVLGTFDASNTQLIPASQKTPHTTAELQSYWSGGTMGSLCGHLECIRGSSPGVCFFGRLLAA